MNRAARRRGEKQPWWQRPQAIVGADRGRGRGGDRVPGPALEPERTPERVVRPAGVAADGGVTRARRRRRCRSSSTATSSARLRGLPADRGADDRQARRRTARSGSRTSRSRSSGRSPSLASNAAYCAGTGDGVLEATTTICSRTRRRRTPARITTTSLTSYGNAAGVDRRRVRDVREGRHLPAVRAARHRPRVAARRQPDAHAVHQRLAGAVVRVHGRRVRGRGEGGRGGMTACY